MFTHFNFNLIPYADLSKQAHKNSWCYTHVHFKIYRNYELKLKQTKLWQKGHNEGGGGGGKKMLGSVNQFV